jgi:hypothetical protein
MQNKNIETQNEHPTSHASNATDATKGEGTLANEIHGDGALANEPNRDAALLADALLTALKLPGNAATPEFHALAQKLQFANSSSPAHAAVDAAADSAGDVTADLSGDVTAGFNLRSPQNSVPSVSSVSKSSPPPDARLANQLAELDRRIDDLNDRFLTTLLDNAIAEARILPAERKYWQAQLATDFQTASADLANAKPKLNLVSRTDNLPHASPLPSDPQQKSKRIQGIIKAKMTADNLSYDEAWAELKSENPGLFRS